MLNPNLEIAIPCQSCGYKICFSIKDLKKTPDYLCPNCKSMNHLDDSGVNKSVSDVEDLLANIFR
jgi:hypothetical protein